jgi:hypothetical protein
VISRPDHVQPTWTLLKAAARGDAQKIEELVHVEVLILLALPFSPLSLPSLYVYLSLP